ncbi:putative capsular polysaccharide synthesis family protein [Thalassomonas sp. RHCl1]|uniref:putative capsular polysaccharide synthesis family protein n=1 Tax=Thalassomonas sp. RHCl1 TaxID=2995320 RepID=UPI00248CC92B|nr:putative capsular polysaccharide synthesis family protein [Thalassomonas sp. RHCl1]
MLTKKIRALKSYLDAHRRLIARYKAADSVFIYQMGKVGSTSLEHSLANAVHVHAFYSQNHTCPVRLQGLAKFGIRHIFYRAKQEVLNYLLRRAFKQRKKTKIITLVREPVARNVSMFFHDLDAYLFAAFTNCVNSRAKPLATRSQGADLLMEVFNQEFNHQYPLDWFEQEFLPMTGINIYEHPFDSEQGFAHIVQDNIELLCIRTDKLALCGDVLEQFCVQPVELLSRNVAERKWYADVYQQFLQQYQPDEQQLVNIFSDKFSRHFFSEQELKGLVTKYSATQS